jgi:hypothetical protein
MNMKRSLWNRTFSLRERTNEQQMRIEDALPGYERGNKNDD